MSEGTLIWPYFLPWGFSTVSVSHAVASHAAKSSVSLSYGRAEELRVSGEQAGACQEAEAGEQMALCGRSLDSEPHPAPG